MKFFNMFFSLIPIFLSIVISILSSNIENYNIKNNGLHFAFLLMYFKSIIKRAAMIEMHFDINYFIFYLNFSKYYIIVYFDSRLNGNLILSVSILKS